MALVSLGMMEGVFNDLRRFFKKALLVHSALHKVIDHSHGFPLDVHQRVELLP